MTYPYFWLGEEAEGGLTVTVTFDFDEGLPDEELCEIECKGDDYKPLPEERPAEYGPVEFDIEDLDDE